jgi:PAS domain S-box-containing protein
LLKPRTIRGQLIAGLLVFEVVVVAVFAFFVVQQHRRELRTREHRRLEYQSSMLALLAADAVDGDHFDVTHLQRTISEMMEAPSIRAVQITDPSGRTILGSDPSTNGLMNLTPLERSYLGASKDTSILELPGDRREAVTPVFAGGRLRALGWIYPSDDSRRSELFSQLYLTLAFALVGAVGCILLAEYLARSITRPLARLLQATRRIIRDPVDTSKLPPDSAASSELADLTLAFNLMVASIEEQRAGLNDTLALLDSMLDHAPIGLAFFDSKGRFIRMNQFLADMNGLSVGKHIGRGVAEIFEGAAGEAIKEGIESVFATSEPVRDLEVKIGDSTKSLDEPGAESTWLVNIYPVRIAGNAVRWVGAIIVDTTGIKRSEGALRRAEKLAAVGQLSASIAHEINNPLEAITNLLYLLRGLDGLDERALAYTELAQHEVSRMSEIVQQTLRFHRQSTRKTVTNLSEILDSVLSLHRGKVVGLQVQVERRYREPVELYCFAGEMRQIFANLIGNALDAMPNHGGRLVLAVRYSRSWKDPSVAGVRVVIADTGSGMTVATRRRIFEPFFTTKEATGTGLGLWVSAEILQKHDGSVRVRSRVAEPGTKPGTVFMVFLPSEAPPSGNLVEAAEGTNSVGSNGFRASQG